MSLDIFWGGAPDPLTEDPINKIRFSELTLTKTRDDESESEADYYNPQTGETGKHSKRGRDERNLRVPGGIAATAKKITADYDSDDARIIELKQQGYSDEYVATKLKEEGRIRYVGKTVGSRWLRLRKVLEDGEDERLDDELSDWHVGEDDILAEIKNDVDKKFALQYDRLKARKWKEVSIYFAEKVGKKKYTAKACEERFEAIKAGTGPIPIELDDDQESRRVAREARIAKAKADRAAAKQARLDEIAAKKARMEARKKAKEDIIIRKQEATAKRVADKAKRDRIRAERERHRERARFARDLQLAKIRISRDWEMKRQREEKAIYRRYSGQPMFAKSEGKVRKRKQKNDSDSENELDDIIDEFEETDEESVNMTDDENPESIEHGAERRKKRTKIVRRRSNPSRAARSKAKKEKEIEDENATTVTSDFNKAKVTKETLLNPRSIMKDEELEVMLYKRMLPRRHHTESHAEVVARLVHADEQLTVPELNALLKANMEKTTGSKRDKIERLQMVEAAACDRGAAGWTSTDLEFMRGYEGYEGEFEKYLEEALAEAAGGDEEEGDDEEGDDDDQGAELIEDDGEEGEDDDEDMDMDME